VSDEVKRLHEKLLGLSSARDFSASPHAHVVSPTSRDSAAAIDRAAGTIVLPWRAVLWGDPSSTPRCEPCRGV
jgi:hypothetical protein